MTVAPAAQNPTVIITGINQNPTNTPVNVNAAAGQIDVILDVNTNGAQLRSVSATLACPNNTTMTQTQTIAGAASDVEGAAVPVVLSFPTAVFQCDDGCSAAPQRSVLVDRYGDDRHIGDADGGRPRRS